MAKLVLSFLELSLLFWVTEYPEVVFSFFVLIPLLLSLLMLPDGVPSCLSTNARRLGPKRCVLPSVIEVTAKRVLPCAGSALVLRAVRPGCVLGCERKLDVVDPL
jgi:uncharacterized membrane protein